MSPYLLAAGVLILLAMAHPAAAQSVRDEGGCVLLDEMVRAGVHAAATEVEPGTGPLALVAPGSDRAGMVATVITERQACGATVEVVTRAFGSAVAALGMPVSWNYPPHPGDFCWSGKLSECYPSRDPLSPDLQAHQLAFVYDAWRGVRRAVAAQMPRGEGGRVSSYTVASLASALSANLRQSVEGPLHAAYGSGSVVPRDGRVRR